LPEIEGGAWSRNNIIIFVPGLGGPVQRIPAGGGQAVDVTPGQLLPGYPAFLADGRHFLFYVAERNGPGGVYASDLGGSPPKRVFDADSAAVSASGIVLFVRSGALLAQRFDQSRLSLLGTPRRIAERVFRSQRGKAALSVSGSGAILYRSDAPEERRRLAWFDRAGKQLGVVFEPLSGENLAYLNPALSPDERRLAISLAVEDREGHLGTRHIWLLDLARGVRTRLTADPAVDDGEPVWARDGKSLVFARSFRKLVELSISANEDQAIGSDMGTPSDWSPDGKFLLLRLANPHTGFDILALARGAERPFPVVQTEYDERDAQFAPPDGRWIAFQSNESGHYEIYVQPFPNSKSRPVQVSKGGGAQVRWRRDGRELFYIALDGSLMAVPIRFAPDGHSAEPDTPVRLFATNVGGAVTAFPQYVVSADGGRFLMNTVVDNGVPSPLQLILHWRGL
jgi:hypothetical protein